MLLIHIQNNQYSQMKELIVELRQQLEVERLIRLLQVLLTVQVKEKTEELPLIRTHNLGLKVHTMT